MESLNILKWELISIFESCGIKCASEQYNICNKFIINKKDIYSLLINDFEYMNNVLNFIKTNYKVAGQDIYLKCQDLQNKIIQIQGK